MFHNSQFSRYVAASRLWNPGTIKAARDEARAMGVMIRREGPEAGAARGFEVYPMGSPDSAVYAECPREALALADVYAADSAAGRVSLFSALTLRGMAEAAARRAEKAAGLHPDTLATRLDAESKPRVLVFIFTDSRFGLSVTHEIDCTGGRPVTADILVRLAAAAEAIADDSASYERREREAPEPRSLSAARNPEAPTAAPRPRKRLRNRAALVRELAEAHESGDDLAAELAALSLATVDTARDSGGFPLYAFRDGFTHDADTLDSMAYGPAIVGLI